MRPKLIALIAVSAIALVGCAAGEPGTLPTISSDPAAEALKNAPLDSVYDPTTGKTMPRAEYEAQTQAQEAAGPRPEDMFVNALSSTFDGNESKFSKSVRYKMEESYYVERGEEYCEQVEAGKKVEPMAGSPLDNDYEIEHRIMISAQIFLCPQN